MALISLQDVHLSLGEVKLLDGIHLSIESGERVCLLGRNGEGKSTLLRVILGQVPVDGGEVIRNQSVRITELPQFVPSEEGQTIAQVTAQGLLDDTDNLGAEDYRVQAILSQMKLAPNDPYTHLSSGMKRRVLLARALVGEPDLLLLDEPTNHLDLEAITWIEETLQRSKQTILFVTHDRAFLQKLATRILELDRGTLTSWDCDYATYLNRREEMLDAQAKQDALFDKRLAQEEVWIRKGIQARRTRNEGRVRALKAMREQRRQRRDRQGTANMLAQEASKSGLKVIEVENVSFQRGDRTILQDLSTLITRGDKIGVIGPNGAGKTTLLQLLLGQLEPSTGSVQLGTNLEVAYFDQMKASLVENQTIQENVSAYETITVDGRQRHILGYLEDFLFPPQRSRTQISRLSGGERSRVLLAKLFLQPANVLVLDEPTNDLDLETLELLESLLVGFSGTVLLVSHDRSFLNGVVTSILAIEPGGTVKEYAGGYDDYLAQIQSAKPEKRESKAKSNPREPKRNEQPTTTKKLSYHEKKELESLPAQIEALEMTRESLTESMMLPEFYKQDGLEIAKAQDRLQAIETELSEAYERWETLEALRR